MEQFLKKNSYAILKTLFDDDPYWLENVSINNFWVEFKKTLDTLPPLNRFAFSLAIVILSIIPPPYSFFSSIHNSKLLVRKKWIYSWEQSRWIWRKSLFLGIRILLVGSALQLPQTMIHTNYHEFLSEREKHLCLRVREINNE